MSRHPELSDFNVVIERPCEWSDMDVQGHINNVHFIEYFQRVRVSYLEKVGYFEEYHKTGTGIVMASVRVGFTSLLNTLIRFSSELE